MGRFAAGWRTDVSTSRTQTLLACPACGTVRQPGSVACRICEFPLAPGLALEVHAPRLVSALEQTIAVGDEGLVQHARLIADWREVIDTWADYPNVAASEHASRCDEAFGWAVEASQWDRAVVGAASPAAMAAIVRRFEEKVPARRVGERLRDLHVHFIGAGPFEPDDLAEMSGPVGRWTLGDPGREAVDVVVVGRSERGTRSLQSVLQQPAGAPQVFTQEAFIDLLLFGHEWWSDPKRIRAAESEHPGLAAARWNYPSHSRWPTEAPETADAEPIELDGESELHRLGYQITGMSREARWEVLLERAIPVLGVAVVRRTIQRHIALRRGQWEGESRYSHALGEWEYDLDRLSRWYGSR
jgi:hypothetical protein